MTTKTIELLSHQLQFMKSKTPITLFLAGRGAGKSFTGGMKLAVLLAEGKSCIGIAQNYKSCKLVLFKAVTDALEIIGIEYEYNMSEMTIRVGLAILYGFSAESGEAIRGITNVKALLIDEACLCPINVFNVALACCRGAGDPEIYLISTPRGRHWVNKYVGDSDCTFIHATSYDNTYLSKAFVNILENQYDSEFAKQELMGQILDADAPAQMIPGNLIDASIFNGPYTKDRNHVKVLSIDVAREGNDSMVICNREGDHLISITAYKGKPDDIDDEVMRLDDQYKFDYIIVDSTGHGAWFANQFKRYEQLMKKIVKINFSESAYDDTMYSNKRTEMYGRAKSYFQKSGKIPLCIELIEDLKVQEYYLDSKNRFALHSKVEFKKELGRSPDWSDAFCLSLMIPSKNADLIFFNRVSDHDNIDKLRRFREANKWYSD